VTGLGGRRDSLITWKGSSELRCLTWFSLPCSNPISKQSIPNHLAWSQHFHPHRILCPKPYGSAENITSNAYSLVVFKPGRISNPWFQPTVSNLSREDTFDHYESTCVMIHTNFLSVLAFRLAMLSTLTASHHQIQHKFVLWPIYKPRLSPTIIIWHLRMGSFLFFTFFLVSEFCVEFSEVRSLRCYASKSGLCAACTRNPAFMEFVSEKIVP